jgi:hypothetical protein
MHSGYCDQCKKRKYTSRSNAKLFLRTNHPGDRMRAYKCPYSDYFHVGHLSRLRVAGL